MAYWIIEDQGFGGVTYRCSHCRESWNEYYQKFPKDFCAWCGESIDEDDAIYIEEIKKTGVIGKWKGVPVLSIPDFVEWLQEQKYTNVDETNTDMTEEFEKEHRWELSRNCFINEIIRHLEEVVNNEV